MKILFFLLLFFPLLLSAEIYKYIDDSGNPIYVDKLEHIPEKYRTQVKKPHKLPKITKTEFKFKNSDKASTKPAVELYVTAWCGYCKKAENFMKKHKVKYKKYDIEKNATGRRKHTAAGGGGVPVIKIGDKIIRGFNANRLRKELGL